MTLVTAVRQTAFHVGGSVTLVTAVRLRPMREYCAQVPQSPIVCQIADWTITILLQIQVAQFTHRFAFMYTMHVNLPHSLLAVVKFCMSQIIFQIKELQGNHAVATLAQETRIPVMRKDLHLHFYPYLHLPTCLPPVGFRRRPLKGSSPR